MTMGKSNVTAAFELSKSGRLHHLVKNRKGIDVYTLDLHALVTLLYMANNSYDWPLTPQMKSTHTPARAYEFGQDPIVSMFTGGEILSDDEKRDLDLGEALGLKDAKHSQARPNVSKDIATLTEYGLIKKVRKERNRASRNKNAAYLLMLGDEEENGAVEDWWNECVDMGWDRKRRGL